MGFLLAVGDDRFTGNNKANEWVIGGAGNDSIQLADNLQGNVLATVLLPVALPLGFDGKGGVADGGEGDDVLESGKGNDVLIGGMGHDQLVAGEGHDILAGGAGHDILSGGEGNDLLSGGSGDDVLQGDAGDDVLYAGDGMDVLRGGSLGLAGSKDGQDTFHFAPGDSVPDSQQVDIIVDFLSMRRAVDAVGLTKANAVHDKLVLDWYANDLSPELYAKSPLEALDTLSGKGVVAASGVGYDVLFGHYKDKFAGKASLLEAADAALDDAYTSLNVAGLLAGAGKGGDGKADYLALGVQFEYGAHTYVAVDAYVDKAGAEANRWNPTYDLLVQVDGFAHLAHEKNVWGVTVEAGAALEVVVVRWDTVTL